ncbi:S9 family peptidase [Stenotrophomonas sp.]|uniref:alpha/beta hydrolase family protein n=1 Tax=Stenotrophomonas sp. TaxID=69392 RepID=UPI0029A4735D|nr:S9 family peptidase [Stenotrophomonas sp.]MDX3934644.1 S9 family peptidase [Stenotrophomonas sp.]
MKRACVWGMTVLLAVTGQAGAVDLEHYLRRDTFTDIKISPTGAFYAATIPMEDRTGLAIVRREDGKLIGSFVPPKNNHANDFDWVNDKRVLIGLAEKFGSLDEPQPTGELFGINADGGRGELLIGYRVQSRGPGTRIQPKKVEAVAAFMIDALPDQDRRVLVKVMPFSVDPFTSAERLDVNSGQRTMVARAPVQRADFVADGKGDVRFADGAAGDNVNKLYYRDGAGAAWKMINDQGVSQRIERALGFSEDGRLAYLLVEQPSGPDTIVSWNPATGERHELLRDAVVDPARVIYRRGTSIPIGALYLGDTPRTRFFDETSADARLQRSLEQAFGGQAVFITSSSRDGRLAMVQVWSGSNPGDFYVFDTQAKKADLVVSRSQWVDPDTAAVVQPIALKARDGMPLHGFVTRPRGSEGKRLPMVVMPHGGPFFVHDDGAYDMESQLLAAAGYAVLQVNYRGSSNFGRAHANAGSREWGGAMQDDLTDATRWAVAEGIADGAKICMYGASYGGYAALMGVAKEPSLYACAAGYVGVYDLPIMYTTGDIQRRGSGETYLREWVGDRTALAAVSPVNLADRIKVPVFLAAGGEDERAPILHTRRMEAALKKAGVPVETLYYPTEGHGFYTDPHRREYYTRLLAFLSNSLGGQTATVSTPTQP